MFTEEFVFDLQRFVTINNSASNTLLSGTSGNDSIYNDYGSNVTINAGAGDDSIENFGGSDVTVDLGAGNDSIVNTGNAVSIDAGDGNDSIDNSVSNVSINAGDGDDIIENCSSNVTINAGAGNDSIDNDHGDSVTIDAGTGDDLISLRRDSKRNVIVYNAGDGSDTIVGLNADDTLSISGGSYSTQESGNNILVTVGDGSIFLKNVYATAGSLHINDKTIKLKHVIRLSNGDDSTEVTRDSISVLGGAGKDSICNYGDSVTIQAGKGSDTIINGGYWNDEYHGSNVSIDAGDDNDYISNNHGEYVTINAGAGDDFVNNQGALSSVDGGAGDDSINNWSEKVTINAGTGNDIIYNSRSNVTIDAGDGDDYIRNGGDSVTIDAGSGNDYISNSGSLVTIAAGAGNDSIYNYGSQVTIDAGEGNDSISLGTSAANNVIVYNEGDGNDTIRGFNEDDTLKISGGSYSISKGKKNVIVTVDDGKITLVGAASLSAVNIDGEEANTWKLNGTTATYGSLVITGVTSLDGIKLDGTTVTVSAASLGKKKVTVSDGYKLALGSDVDKTSTKKSWTLSGSTATYKQTTTAGYSLVDNEIIYSKAATENLITVSGVKSLDGLKVKGTTVTVTKSSLGTNDVKISDGYTLALGSTVPAPTTAKATYASGKYKTAGVSKAGYTLSGNTIRYVAKDIKTIKFSGAAADATVSNFSLSGKTITVGKAAVKTNGTAFKLLTEGYTLKLGKGMTASATDDAWTLSGSTAKLKRTTTAGYSLDDNTITYTKKSSSVLATVTGVKSLDGLSVSGKTVTVNAASLGTDDVSISDGYTLALGDDVDVASTKKSWNLSGSTATYKQTTGAGYSLVDNEIIYSKKVSKTLATVKGVNDKSGLKVSGKTIKLSGDALSKKVTVSGAYTFDFDSDYKNASITGSSSSDTIIARGKNIFVTGGDGSDVFALKSAGTIGDYDSEDKISLPGAANITSKGNDVIFDGKLTVAGAAEKIVTYIENGDEKIYAPEEDKSVQYNADGTAVTLTANYSEDSFVADSTLVTIDASAVIQEINIVANKKANSIVGSEEDDTIDGGAAKDTIRGGDGNDQIFGGKGNDKLFGGAGADSLWGGVGEDTLTGGAGYDFFIYSDGDGRDLITDYEPDVDKIIILSGRVDNPTTDTDGNVTFKVGDGQIVITDGTSKYIELYDGSGNKLTQKYIPK